MTTNRVTPEMIRDLWNGNRDEIDRGDDLAVITRDDLDALMRGSGIDADDWTADGHPAEHMWQVLADSVMASDDDPSPHNLALQQVAEARERLDQARQEITDLEGELHLAIKAALAAGAPRKAIADEAGLSVPRLYQIRDGRR